MPPLKVPEIVTSSDVGEDDPPEVVVVELPLPPPQAAKANRKLTVPEIKEYDFIDLTISKALLQEK